MKEMLSHKETTEERTFEDTADEARNDQNNASDPQQVKVES